MNERLAELESQVKQIYEKLGMSEESEFKVGEWVVAVQPQDGAWGAKGEIGKVTNSEETNGLSAGCHIETISGSIWGLGENAEIRKATSSEIETALRKEWARRTKEKGWEFPDEAEIEGNASGYNRSDVNDGTWIPEYDSVHDILTNINGEVYHDGNWATPKEKKSDKFFEWDVAAGNKVINIGCRTYDKHFLHDLAEALENVTGYTVLEVLDELKKLDL